MAEAWHLFGSDLEFSSTGDLRAASGSEAGRQRVIRRLCANPGDLVFHVDYGAGLPARVGTVMDAPGIHATVRSQMFREAAVAREPMPEVSLRQIPNGVVVNVRYQDADTGDAIGVGMTVDR